MTQPDRIRGRLRTPLDLARNIALLGVLWIAYRSVRSLTADSWADAFVNANRLLDLEQALGFPSEAELQSYAANFETLIRASNAFYFVHFPATALVLAWTWWRHRHHFIRVRNALIAATGIGLVIHVLFPLAPPRMLPSRGFIDTAVRLGPNPYDFELSKGANQIAAMPSLHVGWALLIAIAVIAAKQSRWRYLALAHPVVTAIVVVITGNHYWSDALIAAILVLATWWAVSYFPFTPSNREPVPIEASDERDSALALVSPPSPPAGERDTAGRS